MKELLDRLNKFGETTLGKVVIIGLTLVMLGIVVFVMKNTLFPSPETPSANNTKPVQTQQPTPAESTPEATSGIRFKAETPSFYPLESGFEVFSREILKDPFMPLQEETTQTTQVATTTESVKSLTLIGITSEEGQLKAIVSYDNAVSNLAPGETVGNYLLISVSETSARFLYGDMPVNLEVGQTFVP